ncbi:MAG: C39 family peptidase [Verrucomicrobia bacterium]|nr:C39 family peptidase [Verrucomicrobiota bacterium]
MPTFTPVGTTTARPSKLSVLPPIFFAVMFGLTAITLAAPVFIQDVPDFYQHQLSGYDASLPFGRPTNFAGYSNPTIPACSDIQPLDDGGPGIQWERNGGWCYIASFTSAFYQLDKKGASGLFDQGGDHTWLERMNYAIADFAIHAWGFGDAGPQSAQEFITGKIGAGRIALDRFTWDASDSSVRRNDEITPFTSMYGAYREKLTFGNSIVLDLINPGPANPDWWWSHSYHMVAGAGYDDATSEVYFADPNNKGNDLAQAGWGYAYEETDPLPAGESYYNFNSMDASGLLSGSGGLGGAQVRTMYVLSIVPEPSTYALLLCGGVVSLWASGSRNNRAALGKRITKLLKQSAGHPCLGR